MSCCALPTPPRPALGVPPWGPGNLVKACCAINVAQRDAADNLLAAERTAQCLCLAAEQGDAVADAVRPKAYDGESSTLIGRRASNDAL